MTIQQVISELDLFAPATYQESYDNTGLLTGDAAAECTGVLCSLDVTEKVIAEALLRRCNLIVAHHPVIFTGIKRFSTKGYVERTVISAIKQDVAIYAIHTNLDNILAGVNGRIADKLRLEERQVLLPKAGSLVKLVTYAPDAQANKVRDALFHAGAGYIGNYSECSFNSTGTGTFLPGEGSEPFSGQKGERQWESEVKIEVILPAHLQKPVVTSLLHAHPYEEVAYDLFPLHNVHQSVGSGLVGRLPAPDSELNILRLLKQQFSLTTIRHTRLLDKPVQKIAVCGGAGSFLTKAAIQAGADLYITSDIKYHEFFDADARILLADIGHYESEQFTVELLHDFLLTKFPTFAVLKSEVVTNPVNYF